ncbi:MAG: hypothetical protein JWN24_4856 [Phycisphaerales bacterium]|nr:hypothetical protein [Phycisphaerales bacterium]
MPGTKKWGQVPKDQQDLREAGQGELADGQRPADDAGGGEDDREVPIHGKAGVLAGSLPPLLLLAHPRRPRIVRVIGVVGVFTLGFDALDRQGAAGVGVDFG